MEKYFDILAKIALSENEDKNEMLESFVCIINDNSYKDGSINENRIKFEIMQDYSLLKFLMEYNAKEKVFYIQELDFQLKYKEKFKIEKFIDINEIFNFHIYEKYLQVKRVIQELKRIIEA